MKKFFITIRNLIRLCFILFLVICFIICLGYSGYVLYIKFITFFEIVEPNVASVTAGYTINNFDLDLNVSEDNKVDVVENLGLDFYESGHHGIYRFVPQWLKYKGNDDKMIKRKSIVKDLRAVGEEYSVDTIRKKKRIKIGSEEEYIPKGINDFTIKYQYDMGKDPFKDFDEFIFHAYGDYWDMEIKNPTIKITMPKKFDINNVKFFNDKVRKNDVTEFVDVYLDGNTLYAKYNKEKVNVANKEKFCNDKSNLDDNGVCTYTEKNDKKLTKSLTIDILLPEGYFVGGSFNYGFISFILCMLIMVLTFWTYKRWNKFGKDFPKMAEPIEFYPPEKLSSAEIGYIYGKGNSKKLTVSLIISLAAKGYIKINELKEEKEIEIVNLQTIRQVKIPKELKENHVKVKKLKDDVNNTLTKDEKSLFDWLFAYNDTNYIELVDVKSYELKDSLIEKGFICETGTEKYCSKEEFVKIKQDYDNDVVAAINERQNAPKLEPLNEYERIVYNRLFIYNNPVILSKHETLYKSFNEIAKKLDIKFKDLINDKVASKQVWVAVGVALITIFIYILSYYKIEDMNPTWSIIYYLSFACIFINFMFAFLMKRKTKYGVKLIAEVNGFKNFLETAEKEQLEKLVEENPHYFYDILPFTYVLGVSRKWIKKFEDIPLPKIDLGSFDYNDISSYNDFDSGLHDRSVSFFNTFMNDISSCSSCGGGNGNDSGGGSFGGSSSSGSSGGGCSSCGGGGSW